MPGIEKQRIPTHVATTPYGNPTTTDILGDVPIYYTTDAQGNLIPVKPAEIQNAATNLTPNGIDLRNIGNGAFLYAGSQFYDLGTGNGVLEVFDIEKSSCWSRPEHYRRRQNRHDQHRVEVSSLSTQRNHRDARYD